MNLAMCVSEGRGGVGEDMIKLENYKKHLVSGVLVELFVGDIVDSGGVEVKVMASQISLDNPTAPNVKVGYDLDHN